MPDRIDISLVGERLRQYRRKQNLTLKQVNEETGISVPTLSRLERGDFEKIQSTTLFALSEWMKVSVQELSGKPVPEGADNKTIENTPELVDLHLRADKNLSKEAASSLSSLFRSAYETLSSKQIS